jgi:catechol 2,3-dioxygenase-like lactoylglutathione lyase family enzyme
LDGLTWSNGQILDHIALQCADLEARAAFYDTVLAPLGVRRIVDFDDVVGFGTDRLTFWVGPHRTGEGFRESHIAFTAADRVSVDAFFAAATRLGTEVLYTPRVWPQYNPDYYAAFVRDPDGNNIEAVSHQTG